MNEDLQATATGVDDAVIRSLETMANRLRRHSITSTTRAGSGHPSSCCSCAELVSALFFHTLRFNIASPADPANDRFVLSKGHAAPILWAAWAEAGAFPVERLETLRRIDSELEGHPTPRSPLVDVATGSLGQGLGVGVGMALASRLTGAANRIVVMLGDGETAEGAVWEAAALASRRSLDNLIAVIDVNRLGQSQATMYEHDLESYEKRFSSFGWHTQVIDGHDMRAVVEALDKACAVTGRPAAIVARTLKGKGVSCMENADGWHGKPVPEGEPLEQALREVGENLELERPLELRPPETSAGGPGSATALDPPSYDPDSPVATRQAYGAALARLGTVDPRIVALDGDTKNSTYSQRFMEAHPERFVECFIAEQNMVGAAVGFSALGYIPFVSTFACFLTRAYDHIRMAAVSRANLKLCGSHAGVSIGQDGPSQMGLEDLAMMRAIAGSTVLYPSDAVCAERLVEAAANTPGIVYIRTSRPKTPILYSGNEEFPIGGCKVHGAGEHDRATLVAAGVTLHEALQAQETLGGLELPVRVIDLYSVKPLDEETLRAAARETGVIITVEDHYDAGGLGDAVLGALANETCRFQKLAVTGLPRSGKPEELLAQFGISAAGIVKAVQRLAG